MKRILDYIASVQFFVVLSVLLAVSAAASSLLPQGETDAVYAQILPSAVWTVVQLLQLHEFHSSPLFFILIVLLEVSLLLCTVPRFVKRLKQLSPQAGAGVQLQTFAADVIHLGLVVVIAGGFAQYAFGERYEFSGPVGSTYEASPVEKDASEGDAQRRSDVDTPDDATALVVTDAGERFTSRGDLAGWYVDVQINVPGATAGESVRFGSNDPARTVLGRLHFRDYRRSARTVFADLDTSGTRESELVLTEGEGLVRSTGGGIILVGLTPSAEEAQGDGVSQSAVFADLTTVPDTHAERRRAIEAAPRFALAPGERLGSLELREVEQIETVAFSLTRDPGRIPILLGLLLLAAGMGLYLTKRLTKAE